MAYLSESDATEIVLSSHAAPYWQRREQELALWVQRPKPRRRAKRTAMLGNLHIDAEMLGSILLFKQMNIETEYCCAGVSLLDEPEDHSLYAYMTLLHCERAERFVRLAMAQMRHRLLVTFEPARNRYDLSSFFIMHNRSFCMLLEHCVRSFSLLEEKEELQGKEG